MADILDTDGPDPNADGYSKYAIFAAETEALFGGGSDNEVDLIAEDEDEESRRKRLEREMQQESDAQLAADLFGGPGISLYDRKRQEEQEAKEAAEKLKEQQGPGPLDSAVLDSAADFEAFADLVAEKILKNTAKSHLLQTVVNRLLNKLGSEMANNDLGVIARDLDLLQRQAKKKEQDAKLAAQKKEQEAKAAAAKAAAPAAAAGGKKKRNRNKNKKPANEDDDDDLYGGMVEDEYDFM